MERITDYCTGCRACEQLCASHAINMITNAEGFIEAKISDNHCINCGLCVKVCPQNQILESNKPIKVYALRLRDDEVLSKSASGGAFAGFAMNVISHGGVVYGVSYTSEWGAAHKRIDSLGQLESLQSSKYVQADTCSTYREVKSDLLNNKLVLYSGTGCQISGLKAFLRKDYDNLVTMDLICHGVTSPLMFKKYIEWVEKKEKEDLTYFNFRDKSRGWGLNYRYKTHRTQKLESCVYDPYYICFLSGHAYHECCYSCKYSQERRVSDLTIGDYWGIQKQHPEFFSQKGVSAILINSTKGEKIFEEAKEKFYYAESEFEKVAVENTNLLRPTSRSAIRDNIYKNIDQEDWFNELTKQYRPSFKQRVKRLVPSGFKTILKRFLIH